MLFVDDDSQHTKKIRRPTSSFVYQSASQELDHIVEEQALEQASSESASDSSSNSSSSSVSHASVSRIDIAEASIRNSSNSEKPQSSFSSPAKKSEDKLNLDRGATDNSEKIDMKKLLTPANLIDVQCYLNDENQNPHR